MRNLYAILASGSALIIATLGASASVGDGKEQSSSAKTRMASEASAPYRSSVVGTDFDFITGSDPTAFEKVTFVGFEDFEMPDKRNTGEPLVQKAYVFEANFAGGDTIRIALDKDFGSREAAERDALRYGPRLGRLPALYRAKIRHVVVHFGGEDTTAFAEDKGHFFTIYSANATKRISTHDLEETFFHEGTHASIQDEYIDTPDWKDAVARDAAYITDYSKSNEQEDFAESALFAYTLIHHPERLPASDREKILAIIPNRLAFFRKVYSQ